MFSNVIVVVTISCRSFVFSQSRAKISAGFTNVSGLAVAAFDLAYSSAPCLSSGLSLVSLRLVSSRRKVWNTYIVRLYYTCDSFRGASDVRYSRCRNRASADVVV